MTKQFDKYISLHLPLLQLVTVFSNYSNYSYIITGLYSVAMVQAIHCIGIAEGTNFNACTYAYT